MPNAASGESSRKAVDALARQELSRFRVPLSSAVRSAHARFCQPLAKLRYEAFHRLAVASRRVVARVGRGP
jgi:hypothetical protein